MWRMMREQETSFTTAMCVTGATNIDTRGTAAAPRRHDWLDAAHVVGGADVIG